MHITNEINTYCQYNYCKNVYQTVALPCTTYVRTCNYWQVKFLAICITVTIGCI